MKMFTLALAFVLSAPSAFASTTPFLPVDEAGRDRSFLAFRGELLRIVDNKDAEALLAHVHPGITNSFGGDGGIDEFKAMWELDGRNAGSSQIWKELKPVLMLGGRFSDGEFVAPYVFANWPDEMDPFENLAVIASNVRVRAEPSLDAEVIDRVSYEIVEHNWSNSTVDTPGWTPVRTARGRRGYVADQFLRSAIDYRAIFTEVNGQWKMSVLVAGD